MFPRKELQSKVRASTISIKSGDRRGPLTGRHLLFSSLPSVSPYRLRWGGPSLPRRDGIMMPTLSNHPLGLKSSLIESTDLKRT